MPDFSNLKLPSWMDRGEPAALLRAAVKYWQWVAEWIQWPLKQLDPLTCKVSMLNMLAWERDIARFSGEPLELYRKRVAYAFINARDAGSKAGFERIFERLGIGYVEQLERQPDIDWDVITLRVTDSQVSANSELLLQIIRKYGRTCRRYQFEVLSSEKMIIHHGSIGGEYICYHAPKVQAEVQAGEYVVYPASELTDSATFGAKL